MTRATHRRGGVVALALAFAVALGAIACGGSGRPDIAANVDGRRIRSVDVEQLTGLWTRSQLRQQTERHLGAVTGGQAGGPSSGSGSGSLSRKEVARLVLGFLVRRAVLEQLAAARGIKQGDDPKAASAAGETPEAELAASGSNRAQMEASSVAGELSKALAQHLFPDVPVSEAEIRERFDRQPEVFAPSWQAQVKSAQFDKEAPVALLKEAVGQGEPFEAAASRLGSRETLDLGVVNSIRAPQPIRAALEGLQPKTVSAPVQVQNGFLALFVESRENLPGLTFEQARPELQALLADEKRQSRFMGWFDEQVKTARIDVADYYGHWDRALGQIR